MLTERQLFILQVLIDDYIQHVEPVGSRTISKRSDVSFSPATIRNELADLEDMGFLEKTHTSSGRIPSEKGYRFYVDHLLPKTPLSVKDMDGMKSLFYGKQEEAEKLFEHSAKILSDITNYTAIILGPQAMDMTLRHLQMIPLTSQSAVAIFVTNTGHVENRQVIIPEGIKPSELEKLVNILNERLQGVPLIDLAQKVKSELLAVFKTHLQNAETMDYWLSTMLSWGRKDKLFYGGKTNLFSQPEFRDLDKVRALLDLLETKDLMEKLLVTDHTGLTIRIGHENELEAVQDCSVINASYTVHGKHLGTISIIGPTRMEYQRVIGIMDLLSREMSSLLTDTYDRW